MSNLETMLALPGLSQLRRLRFERRFATRAGGGAYRGAFATFADAAASMPAALPGGYDTADASAMYRDRLDRVFPADYPALYWLRKWITAASRVVDFGGHVGVSFYAFARYLDAVPAAWTVSEVPAVAQAGEALARERGARGVHFVSDISMAGSADVLLAAGSLQYVEPSLTELLDRLPSRPRYVVVNKLPTHARRTFWTVQHIGVGYCPYRITAADALPAELARAGYALEDRWENAELRCHVPFEPDTAPITYRGYAFRRADEA